MIHFLTLSINLIVYTLPGDRFPLDFQDLYLGYIFFFQKELVHQWAGHCLQIWYLFKSISWLTFLRSESSMIFNSNPKWGQVCADTFSVKLPPFLFIWSLGQDCRFPHYLLLRDEHFPSLTEVQTSCVLMLCEAGVREFLYSDSSPWGPALNGKF